MSFHRVRLWLTWAMLGLAGPLAAAPGDATGAPPTVEVAAAGGLAIGDRLQVVADPDRRLDVRAVARGEVGGWLPPGNGAPSLGYVRHPHWVRIRLHNPHPHAVETMLVLLRGAQHEHALWRIDAKGRPRPVAAAAYSGPHAAAAIPLPAGRSVDLIARADSRTALVLDYRLSDAATLQSQVAVDFGIAGALLGVALMAITLAWSLARATRDARYAWFAGFALFGLLYHLHTNGVAFALLWPDRLRAVGNAASTLSACLAVVCLVGFHRWFLDLPRHYPKLDRYLLRPLLGMPLIAAVLLPKAWWLANAINALLVLVALLTLAALSLRSLRDTSEHLRAFVVASGLFVASTLPFVLVRWGLLPGTTPVFALLQGSWAAALAAFAIAIGGRVRWAEREARRLQRQHESELASLVQARTAELDRSNQALREEMRERERTGQLQAALHRIAEAAGDGDVIALCATAHSSIAGLLPAKNLFIALLDGHRERLEYPFAVDEDGADSEPRRLSKALAERVLSSRMPLLLERDGIERLRAQGELVSYGEAPASWLGVPLRGAGNAPAIGVLAVESRDDAQLYQPGDVDLLGFIAYQLANSLQRVRTAELLRAANAELQLLGDIGRELTTTLDAERAFERLYAHMRKRLDCYVFALGLYSEAQGEVQLAYLIEGDLRQPPVHFALTERERPAVWCVCHRRELVTRRAVELRDHLGVIAPVKSGQQTESIVYLPLLLGERVIGCLTVQSRQANAYDSKQLQFLRAVVSYAAIALDNALSYAQLSDTLQRLQRAQEQLLANEKLAAAGQLTAGMAHEINNPNNFIAVGAQNLLADIDRFERFLRELAGSDADAEVVAAIASRLDNQREQVAAILNGAQRIRAIVDDLRTFSRLDEAEFKAVDIDASLRATVNLASTRFGGRVPFACRYHAAVTLECHPAPLNQALMALLVNAGQAVESRRQRGEDGYQGRVQVTSRCDGAQLQIDIEDDGIGMDAAILARLFEPFFTTRPVGEGTGLGLALAWRIVHEHGGDIVVQSQPGQGSSFRVRLPLPAGGAA